MIKVFWGFVNPYLKERNLWSWDNKIWMENRLDGIERFNNDELEKALEKAWEIMEEIEPNWYWLSNKYNTKWTFFPYHENIQEMSKEAFEEVVANHINNGSKNLMLASQPVFYRYGSNEYSDEWSKAVVGISFTKEGSE